MCMHSRAWCLSQYGDLQQFHYIGLRSWSDLVAASNHYGYTGLPSIWSLVGISYEGTGPTLGEHRPKSCQYCCCAALPVGRMNLREVFDVISNALLGPLVIGRKPKLRALTLWRPVSQYNSTVPAIKTAESWSCWTSECQHLREKRITNSTPNWDFGYSLWYWLSRVWTGR